MIFKEKLTDWYGENVKATLIGKSEDDAVAIYLIEDDEDMEITRIFQFGNQTSLSVDKKFQKSDVIKTVEIVVEYLNENRYLKID